MTDETLSTKEQYYDVKKYKDEVATWVRKKKCDLDQTSRMEALYKALYNSVYAGTTTSDVERYPHAAEMFKVYKASIIEACLSGYSALLEVSGRDAYSMLKVPKLKSVMTDQFKSIALLEKLSGDNLDDWLLKGESVAFIKLKENKEEYRNKETAYDLTTGEEVLKFTIKEFVTSRDIEIDYINPFDFFVDAYDYERDPRGCCKIIRSWINSKTLLTSDAFPLLSNEDKEEIVESVGKNATRFSTINSEDIRSEASKTDRDKIEVLTFYGDYITNDNKVLVNIKATIVNNRCADIRYNPVSTNRIIYAPYKIDEETHRAVAPLAVCVPVNVLVNRCTDMFLKNLEDASIPWILYQKGTMTQQEVDSARINKQLEYNSIEEKPELFAPSVTAPQGLQLIQMVLEQNKNVLGLNSYLAGNTDGSVRTAREAAILSQSANARMRVETDVFSYRFLLNLFTAFYTFNREIALAVGEPLDEIYADPKLNVSISTNASRSDKEGELQRLMQMLQLPIAQMIFSNLDPDQIRVAVRYLMAKAELQDVDNILELMEDEGLPEGEAPAVPVGNLGQVGMGDLIPSEPPETPEEIEAQSEQATQNVTDAENIGD